MHRPVGPVRSTRVQEQEKEKHEQEQEHGQGGGEMHARLGERIPAFTDACARASTHARVPARTHLGALPRIHTRTLVTAPERAPVR